MATGQTNKVLQQIRRVLHLGAGAELTDGQLLDCFIQQRDESAFAALVRRHGPMVWGVCRRALHNSHDAEDAFQAAFLVLVRKAASIRPREMVASWLYGVANNTAAKARAMIQKRRGREKQVAELPEPEAARQETVDDLPAVLDQELSGLPERYRIAILLCDLEGKTRKEAAHQLGVPEGTLSARLTRARRMLAGRLTRRGLKVSGGIMATALGQAASAEVPAAVVWNTVKAANGLAAGQAASVVSARVAALTEGVLKTMLLQKLKIVAVVLVIVALLGTGTRLLTYRTQAEELPGAVLAQAQPTEKKAKEPAPSKEKEDARLNEVKKLEGNWIVVSDAGALAPVLPLEKQKGAKWIIENGLITFAHELEQKKDRIYRFFQVDPTKTPKTISLYYFPKPEGSGIPIFIEEGIYELTGDQLKIHFAALNQPKPVAFPAKPGPGQVTLLQREKQPKPGLSARIEVKTKLPIAGQSVKAELVLTNETDQPLRLCTLVNGPRSGDADGTFYKTTLMPDVWKSDSPSPEMSAKNIVTILPGKSVAIPFSTGIIRNPKSPLTIHAGYAVGDQFAKQHNTWSGEVQAKPVTVKFATEAEQLQGRWIGDAVMELKDNNFDFRLGKGHFWGTFTTDPGKSPKEIDVTITKTANQAFDPRGGKWKGIYSLEGTNLKLCFGVNRPTEFQNKESNKQDYFQVKKVLESDPKDPPPKPEEPKKPLAGIGDTKTKLWAGISVSQPVFVSKNDTVAGIFQINFTIVNDGDKTIDPEINSSKLLVNGKELKDWEFLVSNGPKDNRFKALPPKDFLLFGMGLGDRFEEPGIYRVSWQGKAFQSNEIVFRVVAKKSN